ncbi:MAG: hypothetical protein ACTHLE_16480 [Agriterribacter sp.]
MARAKKIYSSKHYASCVFMMLTLLWLTVSAPFITDLQKQLNKQTSCYNAGSENQSMEENANPFSGLNEEKSGNSGNTLSEYLHEPLTFDTLFTAELVHTANGGASIYIAYYGELLSPPPEA